MGPEGSPLLLRRLGASTGIIAILAGALALNIALFSVVYGALFRPLPFPDADRILHLEIPSERLLFQRELFATLPGILAGLPLEEPTLVRHRTALDGAVVGYSPVDVRATFVSASFFSLFGAAPAIGRVLSPEDVGVRPRPVLLSHALWTGRYGGDESILDRVLTLPGPVGLPDEEVRIVGVMRPGFEFPQGTNAWMSYSIDESLPNPVPNYVRLAPGATAAMIQNALPSVSVVRLREYLRPQEAWALALVLVNCVLLLVVAWTQAGGIASARAWDRLGEFALRRALGATEMQLRLLTTSEVAVAAAVIMAVSWTLSFPLVAAVVGLLPGEMSAGLNVSPGIGAFGFALTVLLVGAMLMVSLSWAAIRAASHNALWLAPAFTTRPRRTGNVQSMLLATHAALVTTLALLAGASFKSFAEVQRIGLGFDPKGLFALVTPVPSPDPAAEELGRQRVKQSLEAVRGLPGVVHAALAGAWPLADPLVRRLITVNGPDPLEVIVQHIGVGYPVTIGARLIEGREALVDEARPLLSSGSVASVGLVNESLARRLQYRGSAVGQVISLSASTTVRIVGVIEDIEDSRLDGQVPPTLYRYRSDEVSGAQLLVRLEDVGSMSQVRATLDAVWGTDASAISVVSVDDVRTRLTVNHRARSMLMGLVTFICIPLTFWGIGGMVHDEIARSARDFAIRLALGAGHLHLRRRFLTKLLTLALSGVVAGSLLGVSLVRLLGASRSVASVDAALVSFVGVSASVIVLSSAVYGLRHLSRITPADLFRSGM